MADYSCYVTVFNDTPHKMTLQQSGDPWGYWNISPPATINPFEASLEFQLKDKIGHNGTEGYVWYAANTQIERVFVMGFSCPFYGDNYCNISNPNHYQFSVAFHAKSDAGEHNNFCPTSGFPLRMSFYIRTFV